MILFISNAHTELVGLRAAREGLPKGFVPVAGLHPDRIDGPIDLADITVVIVRLLGGMRAWDGFEPLAQEAATQGVGFIAVGGESEPDAELSGRSTVPVGVAAQSHRYLVAGGPDNIEQLLRFVSDTVLLTGHGFAPPVEFPTAGVWDRVGVGQSGRTRQPDRPLVAIVFYRAHLVAGNTEYVEALAEVLESQGADVLAVFTYSLRTQDSDMPEALQLCARHGVDTIVTSILAAGSSSGDRWLIPAFEALGIPIIQAPATGRSRAEWADDDAGLSPIDIAMGVAICEFDGRLIGPTYAFKEILDEPVVPNFTHSHGYKYPDAQVRDGSAELTATRVDPERSRRVAELAVAHARLRYSAPPDKRVAIVLSAYPTSRARLGNAVGLDTPASAIKVLHALADAGYQVDRIPTDGDTLMAELADTLTYDLPTMTTEQVAHAPGRLAADAYNDWFAQIAEGAQSQVEELWHPAPGDVYVHDDAMVFPGLDLGGVMVTIQPPRGFGPDPIGTYHAPDMPPPHHYLGFYRWLTARDGTGWGADAIVHLGKHGTLEWLPGKANALSSACFPDIALAGTPMFYPFVVNDPGEGTQAKRRIHATIVDHLPPPLTRADTYDDIARLEQLLDTYAQIEAMDPAKLPALRQQIWDVLVVAEIHRDLDLGTEAPRDDAFDDMILHVDGYLCALKDAQIRGGLHVLGQAPTGDHLIDTVLAATRLPQGNVASLRQTVAERLGINLLHANRTETDQIEDECRRQVTALAAAGWDADVAQVTDPTMQWVANTLVPNLEATTDEIKNLTSGLDGNYIRSGPSGAPSRGGAHVLPTGRNFYSVDPKAIPSPLAWEVGRSLADQVVQMHQDKHQRPPNTVGLVLWGTAAMRTMGDDIAEALALIGVRPTWNTESQRVTGLEPISLAELGRPRVDVTLRISGFFRDAFPHVIDLLDDAFALVADLDEPPEDNPIVSTDDARIYGPPPGGYGSGILPVIESKNWRTDADLAEVYLAWSGFAYRKGSYGTAEPEAMARRFAIIDVALKNQDNREHDIFDSDDYLQDHGGMVAAVRALRGKKPEAWFGDTANPTNPQVRTLAEEAARVVRSRVVNPKWIDAMKQHGYKGAFELGATVDYLFGYDATAGVVQDWMYEKVTTAYVTNPTTRDFLRRSNPWVLRSIAERLLEADQRGMWSASSEARQHLRAAILEAEEWEETR